MLNFIGVGSAFNTKLGNTSAWIRQDDRLMLIDCGGSIFEKLMEKELLKGISSLDICITHTHGDHVGSLGDLVLYCHFILKVQPVIHHPKGERIAALLTLFGVPEGLYVLEDSEEFSLPGWMDITFVLQEHADTMPSYGILLKLSKKTLWYSGDSKELSSKVLERFLRGEIDIFYQDTSGTDYPGALHMGITRLAAAIPESMRHRVICMHQDEAFTPEAAESLGFGIASVKE